MILLVRHLYYIILMHALVSLNIREAILAWTIISLGDLRKCKIWENTWN